MTFEPILPAAVLIAIAAALSVIRLAALYRILARTKTGQYRRVVLRWAGLTAAGLLLVLAAAQPGVQTADSRRQAQNKPSAGPTGNVNVFFVVDRSVDSRVEDYVDHKSRMSGIRSDIEALMGQYPRARFAVISFASRASLDWPLSGDVWSLEPLIKSLSAYVEVPTDAMFQVDAAAANDLLRSKLSDATQWYPGSKNLVFYFGEGAGGSNAPQGGFDLPQGAIAGGAVLGYGTAAGGPIKQGWVDGNLIYMGDPHTNGPAVSGVNENTLKAIASELGVPYFHREGGPIAAVVPSANLFNGQRSNDSAVAAVTRERIELYWLFSGLAAALALGEIFLTLGEFRRNRMPRPARS